jgi:hypothetical protein
VLSYYSWGHDATKEGAWVRNSKIMQLLAAYREVADMMVCHLGASDAPLDHTGRDEAWDIAAPKHSW